VSATQNTDAADLVLGWPRPAAQWVEAAPVGNGRLACMVFGGAARARWQINDSTVWSGTPHGPADALEAVLAAGAGPERLEQVRAAIRAEDRRTAERLLMSFEGPYSQEYLPFADLSISLLGEGLEYGSRTLNLDNGVAAEQILAGGRTITRATWASRPAGAICIALDVEGGTVDLGIELSSPLRVVRRTAAALGVEIPVDGAPQHEPQVAEPLRYADGPVGGYDPFGAVALAIDTDGEVTEAGGSLAVRGAGRVLITVASSTSGADFWSGRGRASREEHLHRAADTAEAAAALGADRLRREHEADLRALLGGMELTVGRRRAGILDVADDVLSGKDEQLTATVVVQLGRYLLAGASRPGGGPPANLQGIWNGELRPPWSSNYTLNINTEMNYWGVWPAGLGACDEPLLRLVERLAETGAPVARRLYGARGWVAHHNTDMWGWALPVGMGHGSPSWAIWMMGGVWLSQHVWDHYAFSQDTDFLRGRGWPLLRGCAEFCLDWLVEGPDGLLDTIPSTSPENLFVSRRGTAESLSASTAMDTALIRALFTNCLAAADTLGLAGDPVCAQIRGALPRLRPTALTADGRLREWSEDHAEQDPHHRHVSQLVALYPLGQIDPEQTPELAAAAARTLDARGPGAMGWSWSWKMALRARLGQGDRARALLLEATRPLAGDPEHDNPVDGSVWGGLLPNLLSTHPPFQIDGNYGLMAAVLETVVQDRGGAVRVLPAIPEQWPEGACRGIRCRGGLAVDLAWADGALSTLTVRRLGGEDRPVRIRYRDRSTRIRVAPGAAVRLGPDLRPPDGPC
jgi:alpha-L-fucosidase 2